MLDHGADVKAYDPLGRTALMYAAVSDMLPLDEVKLLIEHGADVNARSKHPNAGDEGLTVLDMAKRNGDTPIVHLLEQSGAKPAGLMPVVLTPQAEERHPHRHPGQHSPAPARGRQLLHQLRLRLLPQQQPDRDDHGAGAQARASRSTRRPTRRRCRSTSRLCRSCATACTRASWSRSATTSATASSPTCCWA